MDGKIGIFRKKEGPGRFYLRSGRGVNLVGPGETIHCRPEELGSHIDKFDRLDSVPESPPVVQYVHLRAIKREDGKGFDVISDFDGKPINDIPLTKAQAEAIAGPLDDEADTAKDISIDDLSDIPANTQAALKKAGLKTVADLVKLTDEELLEIPGIAEKSMAIIREACDKVVAGTDEEA